MKCEGEGNFPRRGVLAIGFTIAILLNFSAHGTTYYLSPSGDDANDGLSAESPKKTLLDAMAIAADNDTIHFLAGEYTELTATSNAADSTADYLAVLNRSLVIEGEGPENTILHLRNQAGSAKPKCGFWLNNSGARLSGVTITDVAAKVSDGDNTYLLGKAIHIVSGVASNCVVRGITQTGQNPRRSPVALRGSGALLVDSVVADNIAGIYGKGAGGIYVDGGKVLRSVIRGNVGGDRPHSGGVWLNNGSLIDCEISGNVGAATSHTEQYGDDYCTALYVGDNTLVENCRIFANTNSALAIGAQPQPGGVLVKGTTSAILRNCIIARNVAFNLMADIVAGGLYVDNPNARLEHLTVTENHAPKVGGILLKQGAILNSISYFNSASDLTVAGGSVSYSCFPAADGTNGNISSCPSLLGIEGNYALSKVSPCVDAVENDEAIVATDINHNSRDSLPDMGATEFVPGALGTSYALSIAVGKYRNPAGEAVEFSAAFDEMSAASNYTWTLSDGVSETTFSTAAPNLTLDDLACGKYTMTVSAQNEASENFTSQALAFIVAASEAYVSPDGENIYPYETPEKAARLLRDAVEAVYATDECQGVIHIAAGNYPVPQKESPKHHSNIAVIYKPVTIVGAENPDEVVLRAGNTGSGDFGCGIILYHPKALLHGVTLTGQGYTAEKDRLFEFPMLIEIATGTLSNAVVRNASSAGTHTRPAAGINGGLMTHTEIRDNQMNGWGRRAIGLRVTGGVVEHSKILRNGIPLDKSDRCNANGVYMTGGVIRDSVICGNYGGHNNVSAGASGVYITGGLIERSIIQHNTNSTSSKVQCAGGVFLNGAATLKNCLIANNVCASVSAEMNSNVGGIYINHASGVVSYTTIANNQANDVSGLIDSKGAKVEASIILGTGGEYLAASFTPSSRINYCCFPTVGSYPNASNSFDTDPFLSYALQTTQADFESESGFALLRQSPCRDAVKDEALFTEKDLLSRERSSDGETSGNYPDIGCYEYAEGDSEAYALFMLDNRVIPVTDSVQLTATFVGDNNSFAPSAYLLENKSSGETRTFSAANETLVLGNLAPGLYDITLYATNSLGGALDPCLMENALTVSPQVTYVAKTGKHRWPFHTRENASTNLYEALDAVYGSESSTGTVFIAEGYYEAMKTTRTFDGGLYLAVVQKPVRIIGSDDPLKTHLNFAVEGMDFGGGIVMVHDGAMLCGVTLSGYSHISEEFAVLDGRGKGLRILGGIASNVVITACRSTPGNVNSRWTQAAASISSGLLIDSVITNNANGTIAWGRRALGLDVTGGEVRRCVIANNSIDYSKGDFMLSGGVIQSGGIVSECIISNNYAVKWSTPKKLPIAGGVYISGGLMERCIISKNHDASFENGLRSGALGMTDNAGGMIVDGDCTVKSCLIEGNISDNPKENASSPGVMITSKGKNAKLINLTIADNQGAAAEYNNAVMIAAGEIINSIISAPNLPTVRQTGGTISHSCFIDAAENVNGNIAADPRFQATGSYELMSRSPCRGIGDSSFFTADEKDLAGIPRLRAGNLDLGCYQISRYPGTMLLLK